MSTENDRSEGAAVLSDKQSIQDAIHVGSMAESEFDSQWHEAADAHESASESHPVEETNAPATTTEGTTSTSSDPSLEREKTESQANVSESVWDISVCAVQKKSAYSEKNNNVTHADKTERLSNITLGQEPRSVYFILSKSISIDYSGPVKARDGAWEFELVNEDGEDKIRFTPFKAGEYEIPVPYNNGKMMKFLLTVNPDPWSLWTVKEIDDKAKVFAADDDRIKNNHKDIIAKDYPGLKIIGASRRGRSHERSGTFRDDDMGIWSDAANGNYVFMVSDGAGSCRFSREGARIAIALISEKLENNKALIEETWKKSAADIENNKKDSPIGMTLTQLARLARDKLAGYVAENKASHPDWNIKDFSGTLLLAALKREKNGALQLVTLSIGDGAIAWYLGDGQHGLMCRPDSGEFGGGTRFLTTPEVWQAMAESKSPDDMAKAYKDFCNKRVFCKKFTPAEARKFRLFLMSDGVSDPWFETDARLQDGNVWRQFAEDTLISSGENKAGLVLEDSVEVNAEKLWEWLSFKIAGNHDDRTIIAVYSSEETDNEILNEKKEEK